MNDLVVNQKSAKALNLTVPSALFACADGHAELLKDGPKKESEVFVGSFVRIETSSCTGTTGAPLQRLALNYGVSRHVMEPSAQPSSQPTPRPLTAA